MMGAPAPSAKRLKKAAPAPSGRQAGRETDALAGREKRDTMPTIWPFPIWNGRKVPRQQVARKMPPENWEEAPF